MDTQPTGGRLWRLAYRFDGKQKLLALGAYPAVSLGDARKARDDAKQLLRDGIDPSSDKKIRKAEEEGETFRGIVQEYIARLEKQGRADATITRTKRLLESTYPSLGALPLKDIDAPAVLKVLRLVEDRGQYEDRPSSPVDHRLHLPLRHGHRPGSLRRHPSVCRRFDSADRDPTGRHHRAQGPRRLSPNR